MLFVQVVPLHTSSREERVSKLFNILTPGQPVPALTLKRQAPGRVANGVPFLKAGMTSMTGMSRYYDKTSFYF